MLYLSGIHKEYLARLNGQFAEKPEVAKHLGRKIYSPKNLSLSYRQLNELGKSGLIQDKRKEKKKGWRRFSFIDAVYLQTVFELKKARLTNKELRNFKNSYYKSDEFKKALYLVLAGENIIISIDEKGKTQFSDSLYFVITNRKNENKELIFFTSLYAIVWDFLDGRPEEWIEPEIFYFCIQKIRKELAEYPKENNLSEDQEIELAKKIEELSEILFKRWISDKEKK